MMAVPLLLTKLQYIRGLPISLLDAAAALQSRAFAAASIQLTAIKALRERTSAPISDVKSALVEASWDEGGMCPAATLARGLLSVHSDAVST